MEIAAVTEPNWIYDFSDYQQMYDLRNADFSKKILDFSSGISSFNQQATKQGVNVVSADPAYALTENQMSVHAKKLLNNAIAQLQADPGRLKEESILGMGLQKVIDQFAQTETIFLYDYPVGVEQKRYQPVLSSTLPYEMHEFGLALCTDFVFHHSFSKKEVMTLLVELCRVAEEVRIFPLLGGDGKKPVELNELMLFFHQNNYGVEIREVPYHILKGANAMLRIWSLECAVK